MVIVKLPRSCRRERMHIVSGWCCRWSNDWSALIKNTSCAGMQGGQGSDSFKANLLRHYSLKKRSRDWRATCCLDGFLQTTAETGGECAIQRRGSGLLDQFRRGQCWLLSQSYRRHLLLVGSYRCAKHEMDIGSNSISLAAGITQGLESTCYELV